ncbi:MAG TPA: DUF664 domain-containing protein [Chitinophagaceae bacterium]
MTQSNEYSRRGFIKKTSLLTAGIAGLSTIPGAAIAGASADEGINIVGPKAGYTPQVGTLVSMMDWMRFVILRPVHGMTVEQLDYLHDDNSNSIGAMLYHLAATEKYYQLHTFGNMRWGSWDTSIKKEWDIPMGLGVNARKSIKGNPLDFYLEKLQTVRDASLAELKKRDDKWLLTVDQSWPWGPTNNYCKWFHVVEHESNHNGQIKYIKSRLPGAKPSGD